MIFTDNSTYYLNFKSFAGLPDKLTDPQGQIPLQHMEAVLGYPHKMVLNFELCMTPMAIFHSRIISQLLAECYPPKGGGFNLLQEQ